MDALTVSGSPRDQAAAEYITVSAEDYHAKLEELGAIKYQLRQAEERQQATQPRPVLRLAEYSLPAWREFAERMLDETTVGRLLDNGGESYGGAMSILNIIWDPVPVARMFEIIPPTLWPGLLEAIAHNVEVFTYCENTDGEHCDYECSDNERRPQHKATVELVWLP
jgi:hypothetical protein